MSSTEANKFLVQVDLEPIGRRIDVNINTTVLDAARAAGVELASICGGTGSCGACKIYLVDGFLSPLTTTEKSEYTTQELESGVRLACQAKILSDVRIDIPSDSLTTPQRLQVEGVETDFDIDPVVAKIDIILDPPRIDDLRSDLTRVKEFLATKGFKDTIFRYPVLKVLSNELRANHWEISLILKADEIVALLPRGKDIYGLAVDVGTTKVAVYLVNLQNGETVAKTGAMNPQIAYGEDVISRIAYANDHDGGENLLHEKIIGLLNNFIYGLIEEVKISHTQIVDCVIVGNTAMHHIVAGLPVQQLGAAPYVPSVSDEMDIACEDLGLDIAPGAYVYLPPNIAGYVGADHVSMLLASNAAVDRQNAHTIVSLDIGTNTEISLYHWGRHWSCSCASGPAFEGAHIRDGMRAAPGAIERVRLNKDEVQIQTIGNQPPVGICGSGILDAVAEFLRIKVIDERGVFNGKHPNLRQELSKKEFILSSAALSGNGREVVITRKDVNEIQLAKGAIRAGVEVLLNEAGIVYDEIDEFIVAGAFGTYLDIESAVQIGMFPDIPRNKFLQVGNAAGLGAKKMLISRRLRREAMEIIKNVEYIELTTHPGFTDEYMEALAFQQ